jgi:UDP-glucose 4-epimerase
MGTILITGGAGFIGAYVVQRLIKVHKVVIVDNLRKVGGVPYVHPKAEFINGNICDSNVYEQLDAYSFDAVYHLAAQSGGESAYDDIRYDIMTNSYGTALLVKYCKKRNIPRFIYTSTVAVYGSLVAEDAFTEESKIKPDAIYGVSKYSGELLIQQELSEYDGAFTIFRVFNTYGPGENLAYGKKGMASIYAAYLWRGEPICIKGSLDRIRDLTYIDDNVDILCQSLTNKSSFNRIYNLSSGVKTTVAELVSCMIDVFEKPSDYKVVEAAGTPGDSFSTHANIDRLKNDFNWSPRYSLREGLKKYYAWIKQIPIQNDLQGYHPFDVSDA